MRAIRNSWIRAGVLFGALSLVCALAGTGLVAAAPVSQATTGTVTGQVLSLDDVALSNVLIDAFAQGPDTPNRTALVQTRTDAQGRYSVQVPAGQVWMHFETQDINGQSFWGYDNLPINVGAGETVTGEDFRVAIRIVAEPTAVPTAVPTEAPPPPATPTAVPVTPPVITPGMPSTGAGASSGPQLPLFIVAAALLLLTGFFVRRRATR